MVSVADATDPIVTENTTLLYNEKHSLFDEQAEAMRQGILNTTDDLAPSATGKTYYVSMSGNNANDGLSPSTAWRDVDAVSANAGKFTAGDVVLFERGGVYRGTTQMTTGVSYGAYGTGPKPCLYASPRNYADASLWKKYAMNVWRVEVPYLTDIGNIVFDHGVVCASDYKICDKTQWSVSNLNGNFEYYHDTTAGYLYMYHNGGNPGALYEDIEFCVKDSIFYMHSRVTEVTDVVIDNLCFKYSGSFGVVFRTTQNVTITNCEIGYIGGSMLNQTLRYSDGTTATVSEGFAVSGFDSTTAGAKTVTVFYSGKSVTFSVTVNAPMSGESDPTFVVQTTGNAVRAGDTFTVTINTVNNPGIVSLMVKVGYDADVLELVSAAGQDFAGTTFGPLTANPFAVNWYDTLNPNNTTNGVVAVLTFKVKEDAVAGDTAITLSYNPNNVYDFDFENVTFATVDGTVTVADYMKGDINGDGLVNNKDLGLLQRYINGWGVDIDLRAAEVTGDGTLNNKDLGMLQRYINGWDVTLK